MSDNPGWPCLTHDGEGSTLLVSVVPNAKRTQAVGLHDGALRVRLAAPAIEGRANAALVEWLAHELKLPRRAIELVQGQSARRKRLRLDCPPSHVSAWLSGLGLPP